MSDIQKYKLENAYEYPHWLLNGNIPNLYFTIDKGPQLKPGGKWDYSKGGQCIIGNEWIQPQNNPVTLDHFRLGLDVVDLGNHVYMKVSDSEKFLSILEQGKFIGDYNGEKIFSLNYYGGGRGKIPGEYILEQKLSFLKQANQYKLLKTAGKFLNKVGTVMSWVDVGSKAVDVVNKRDAQSTFGLSVGLLIALTGGGAAAPVILAGSVAIGLYELTTGKKVNVTDFIHEISVNTVSEFFLFAEKLNELDDSQKKYLRDQKATEKGHPHFEPGMSQKDRELTARELRFPD